MFGSSMGIPLTRLHGSWQVPKDRNESELVPMPLKWEAAGAPGLSFVLG